MQHLDQKHLAERWLISPRTLEQWRWQGRGPRYLKIGGRVVYRGRIDDRHVDLGVDRPSATTRDLADALSAVVAGTPVKQPTTKAVGCYIADFVR